MPARPSMPGQQQSLSPVQHAQFNPSAGEQVVNQVKGQIVKRGIKNVMPDIEKGVDKLTAPLSDAVSAVTSPLTNALGLTTAATPVATTAAATAAPLATAAAPIATTAGALAPAAGAGAGMMAAAAPVAIPLAAGAALGKLFGLFNDGGRVPSQTMTAMGQQAPQQNMAPSQAGGPLSFKHAEQQQKLALKQASFDADQKRKEEAHRMKMMQQQQKLTEAVSGFQTPLSAK